MNPVLFILKKRNHEECDITVWLELAKYYALLGYEPYFLSSNEVLGYSRLYFDSIERLEKSLSSFAVIFVNSEFEYIDQLVRTKNTINIIHETSERFPLYCQANVNEYLNNDSLLENVIGGINKEAYEYVKAWGDKIDQIIEKITKVYETFLFDIGIGDTALFLSLFYQYKKTITKPICILAKNEQLKRLLEHCEDVEKVEAVPKEMFQYCSLSFEKMKKLGVHDVTQMYVELNEIIQEKKLSFKGIICQFLGIHENTPFAKERFQYDGKDGDLEFEKRKYVDGKTVLLIPSATTFDGRMVSKEFWEELVILLRSEGYQAVVNAKEPFLDNVPHIFLDIESTLAFAKRCGYVISVRTGLSDLIAMYTNTYVQSLYPAKNDKYWLRIKYSGAEEYLEKASVKNTFDSIKVTELFVEDEKQTMVQVVKNIVEDEAYGH